MLFGEVLLQTFDTFCGRVPRSVRTGRLDPRITHRVRCHLTDLVMPWLVGRDGQARGNVVLGQRRR